MMHCLVYLLEPAGLTWLHTLPVPPSGWTNSTLREAFIQRWGMDSRTMQTSAVDAMVRGKLKQGTSTLAEYTSHFLTQSQLLPNIPLVLLCAQFLHGLHPSMQDRCCLDSSGNPWTDLSALIHHAHAEDYRIQRVTTMQTPRFVPAHHLSRARAPLFISYPAPDRTRTSNHLEETEPNKKSRLSLGALPRTSRPFVSSFPR
jgi:hypothetical protein